MSSEVNFIGHNEGTMEYYCDGKPDGKACSSAESIDFDDGLNWTEGNNEMKSRGWRARMIDGQWMWFCSHECENSIVNSEFERLGNYE